MIYDHRIHVIIYMIWILCGSQCFLYLISLWRMSEKVLHVLEERKEGILFAYKVTLMFLIFTALY